MNHGLFDDILRNKIAKAGTETVVTYPVSPLFGNLNTLKDIFISTRDIHDNEYAIHLIDIEEYKGQLELRSKVGLLISNHLTEDANFALYICQLDKDRGYRNPIINEAIDLGANPLASLKHLTSKRVTAVRFLGNGVCRPVVNKKCTSYISCGALRAFMQYGFVDENNGLYGLPMDRICDITEMELSSGGRLLKDGE